MNLEVKIDNGRKRFYTEIDGEEAYLDYSIEGNTIDFQHTYTPRKLRGKGIAGMVVEFAFEYAKKNNLKVIPTCPFIPAFLEKNEKYKELVV